MENLEKIKKRFIKLCNETGREHIPLEENLDKWNIRDFVSEAQFQANMREEELYDYNMRLEFNRYKRFVNAYKHLLNDNEKCFTQHVSKFDK